MAATAKLRYIISTGMTVALTHLVWMLDMHTEAQLLQDPSLRFDDLVFGIYVVLIKYQ